MEHGMHVVAVGSLIGGFKVYGPFDTEREAENWAIDEISEMDVWWAMPLIAQDAEDQTVLEAATKAVQQVKAPKYAEEF